MNCGVRPTIRFPSVKYDAVSDSTQSTSDEDRTIHRVSIISNMKAVVTATGASFKTT